MNDKQIVEYAKNCIIKNLEQYLGDGDSKTIMSEIFELSNEDDNKLLLAHIKGLRDLLNRAIEILERKGNK